MDGLDKLDKLDDLRQDRPTAAELLESIAATLSDTVVPATAPHAQHQARVAASLCRILQRELSADSVAAPDLPPSLTAVDDETAAAAFATVQDLVRAKLAVNKPGYEQHGAAAENAVIA